MGKRTKLIEARRAKGLNQRQVGELVGLSQGGISRIEAGEFVPNADVARDLMSVLGVSLDDVIGDPPDDSSPSGHQASPALAHGGA